MISKIAGEEVVLDNKVKKDMLGGIKVKFGTKLIDVSMEKIIQDLENKIDG